MILQAETRHKDQIIALWSGAFGDKAEDVEKYLETILEYFLVYEEDGTVKGMLSVLPVSFYGKNGGYIYAVTTDKNYRGQGICNKLMEFVKADKKYDFLVLKPQNDGLFGFYEKMGFEKIPQLEKKEIPVAESDNIAYQLKPLSAQCYENARNSYFAEELVKWDSFMLAFAKDMYSGEFYSVEENGENFGIAFAYKNKEVAIIKELLSKEPEKVANIIAVMSGCTKAECMLKNLNGETGYMVYPKEEKVGYFNIYFD